MIFEDSLGTCRFNTRTNLPLLTEAMKAITGWDMTPEEARNAGLRAVNLMRAFNVQCGITREHDAPSERYGSTPNMTLPLNATAPHPWMDRPRE
jgi:aldehyde:ferredoxin oxidoreductase